METATLGSGCFWCSDAIFRRVKGVQKVVTGYSGGTVENPTMDDVYRGDTGHAECIQITYNPSIISYEKLLEIFFHLHDPTSVQQPGTLDKGPEYRSIIFYHSDAQKNIAQNMINQFEAKEKYRNQVLTEIVKFEKFYPAIESQQEYYEKNSYQPYCQFIIDPKVQKLLNDFSQEVKPEYATH